MVEYTDVYYYEVLKILVILEFVNFRRYHGVCVEPRTIFVGGCNALSPKCHNALVLIIFFYLSFIILFTLVDQAPQGPPKIYNMVSLVYE